MGFLAFGVDFKTQPPSLQMSSCTTGLSATFEEIHSLSILNVQHVYKRIAQALHSKLV